MKRLLLLLLFTILFIGCRSRNTSSVSEERSISKIETFKNQVKTTADDLPIIDLESKYPTKKIKLEDFADIEYISLGSIEDVLIGSSLGINICGDTIVINDRQQKQIVYINRTGEFLHLFNAKGRSSKEYTFTSGLAVDFKKKEIYITDFQTRYRILVYTFEGEYIKTLKTPFDIWFSDIINYDNDYLFVYDNYKLNSRVAENIDLNKKPYILIDKANGKFQTLFLNIYNRFGATTIGKVGNRYVASKPTITNYIPNDGDVIISDFALDTVYSYKDRKLEPILVRKKEDEYILSSVLLSTNRYLFLKVTKNTLTLG